MGSLRDIVRRIREAETSDETTVEQVKQDRPVFHVVSTRSDHVKQDNRQKTGENEACFIVSSPRERNNETTAGVDRLRRMPCPMGVAPDGWRTAILDSIRIHDEGWADHALALGWTALDLFGAVPDKNGDPEADGLAVKLGGRSIVALCASFATVREGQRTAFIYRGNSSGARLLWEVGR